jgi:hypothetical protein
MQRPTLANQISLIQTQKVTENPGGRWRPGAPVSGDRVSQLFVLPDLVVRITKLRRERPKPRPKRPRRRPHWRRREGTASGDLVPEGLRGAPCGALCVARAQPNGHLFHSSLAR